MDNAAAMTPAALRALASRVETEEPSEELHAAVLTAFGSEAEWMTAPNPLRSVDDAKGFQPDAWRVWMIDQQKDEWYCGLYCPPAKDAHAESTAPTEPRARTAAALRALAWEREHDGR